MVPSIIASSLAIKVALMWCYHSTDFEVHRNWMAITYNLPPSQWYFNDVSIWTLDYPPFFAYFEWILAMIAVHVDPLIVTISSIPVLNDNVLIFQRCSVIITEFFLFWATWRYISRSKKDTKNQKETVFTLVALNGGLMLVDHMHFQYNGMLLGLLVLCFDAAAMNQGTFVAVLFSTLVLSKHLFLTLAPVFAAYLWRSYCTDFGRRVGHTFALTVATRFSVLVLIAVCALCLCFGPVLLYDNQGSWKQVLGELGRRAMQILGRLFPLGRGLVHSYWAPNVWSLYYFVDRVMQSVLPRMNALPEAAKMRATSTASTVSGLVGGVSPTVLPDVTAPMCMVLVLLASFPAIHRIFTAPKRHQGVSLLVKATVYTSMSAFMLGYHVHEKAILVPILSQTFLLLPSADAPDAHSLYLELVAAGTASLLPLITSTIRDHIIKLAIFALSMLLVLYLTYQDPARRVSRVNMLVLFLINMMVFFTEIIYPHLAHQRGLPALAAFCRRFEFIPLMATSVTCAVFLIDAWYASLMQLYR